MPPDSAADPILVAVLSEEHRIRTALRALLETEGYTVSVGATAADAATLLGATSPTAVVVGLGAGALKDAEILSATRQVGPDRLVVVGSRDGIDLDAGPDAILAAVAEAVVRCAGTSAR